VVGARVVQVAFRVADDGSWQRDIPLWSVDVYVV
jgi:hypothetical protein